jgi:hypothetical protein
MKLAVNNCGRCQDPIAIIAAIPIGIVLEVNLEINSGIMVEADMKLAPKNQLAVSRVLTVKFQR